MVIPMRNDLDSLRTFLAVCEQGSVSGAANQLGRTQSGVSMQLKRLEDEMGVVLVQRTSRGVVMLDPGRLLRDYARRIVGLCDEARGRLQNTRSSGSVRIGMPEEVATAALWAALGSFRRGRCDTAFQVTLDDTHAIEILWDAAELDIMVVVARARQGRPWVSWQMDLRWVCAADNIVDRGRPLDIVIFAEPCSWRQRMLEALEKHSVDRRITFSSGSVAAVVGAVESGLGATLLPRSLIRRETMREFSGRERPFPPVRIAYAMFLRERPTAVVAEAARVLRAELTRPVT
jgi:DNA-binding transcriptional LysR family regulator